MAVAGLALLFVASSQAGLYPSQGVTHLGRGIFYMTDVAWHPNVDEIRYKVSVTNKGSDAIGVHFNFYALDQDGNPGNPLPETPAYRYPPVGELDIPAHQAGTLWVPQFPELAPHAGQFMDLVMVWRGSVKSPPAVRVETMHVADTPTDTEMVCYTTTDVRG